MSTQPGSSVRTRIWLTLAVVASLLPVIRAFSWTQVFYIRDLGVYFWPRHLSLHDAWRASEWPLWNSYAAAGQSAVADPLNQFFLAPVTLVRLLLPAVPGFNFWVAAPFPLLALGGWLWLRRYASPFGAAVGAALFAVAGPVVSTGNFPNFSWSVALIPWALWATDRLCERPVPGRVAALSGVVALQAVAGEVVSLGATCALLLATALVTAPGELGVARARRVVAVLGAMVVGVLLSAVQTVPLVAAARQSTRTGQLQNLYWSAHPLAIVEAFVGRFFGQPHLGAEGQPWLAALNEGREPLLFSLYIGIGALVLAFVARADGEDRRWRWFWSSVALVGVVCALGEFTPLFPAVQTVVPLLQSFRFPVKYLVFVVVAAAALASTGADTLLAHVRGEHPMKRPTAALVLLFGCTLFALLSLTATALAPEAMLVAWESVASAIHIPESTDAANWIRASSSLQLIRLAGLAFGVLTLFLVVWVRHRMASLAVYALCGMAIVDPLVMNSDLNPTIPARELGPPAWLETAAMHSQDRVYVGGYVPLPSSGRLEPIQWIDAASQIDLAIDVPREEALTTYRAQFAFTPAPWGIRQIISYDLPRLWPREYSLMIDVFRQATPAQRLLFLRRTGVRYCFLPEPPADARMVVGPSPLSGPMALYECGTDPRRVYVTDEALVDESVRSQIALMFDEGHDPLARVLLERNPPAALGTLGEGTLRPSARIVSERANELVVTAVAGPGGGYLTVLDSFDPDWRVEVDGQTAPLLRANGLFRAVRVTAGEHQVRFTYRPKAFAIGAAVTIITASLLMVPLVGQPCLARVRRRRRVDSLRRAPYDALHEYR